MRTRNAILVSLSWALVLAIGGAHGEMVLIVGTGATLIAPRWAVLIYADLARWEIQQRQRRGIIGNLGIDNLNQSPSLKYKRGFFLDWRAADRLKRTLLPKIDFLLDTHRSETPKLITGLSLRAGLDAAVAIDDGWAAVATRRLADADIKAGESGAAGLAGLTALLDGGAATASTLGIDGSSRILIFITEGVTDADNYAKIIAGGREEA